MKLRSLMKLQYIYSMSVWLFGNLSHLCFLFYMHLCLLTLVTYQTRYATISYNVILRLGNHHKISYIAYLKNQNKKIWFKWKYWVYRRRFSWCHIPASLRIYLFMALRRCFWYTYTTWEPNNVISIIYHVKNGNLAIILAKCKMSHTSHFTSKPCNV